MKYVKEVLFNTLQKWEADWIVKSEQPDPRGNATVDRT